LSEEDWEKKRGGRRRRIGVRQGRVEVELRRYEMRMDKREGEK
jgi:hypothetical protein